MTKLGLDKGRIIQKLKTREALIDKANELLKNGVNSQYRAGCQGGGYIKGNGLPLFYQPGFVKAGSVITT